MLFLLIFHTCLNFMLPLRPHPNSFLSSWSVLRRLKSVGFIKEKEVAKIRNQSDPMEYYREKIDTRSNGLRINLMAYFKPARYVSVEFEINFRTNAGPK
jgi:hypothetical protein